MTATVRTTEDRAWLPATEVTGAGGVRRAAVALGAEAGLSEQAQAGLAIVATELATNLARHAEGGVVLLRLVRSDEAYGVEMIGIDRGPGMADLAASTVDGHSTAGTLGIGLGAIQRQASELHAYSRVGKGTVLAATVWSATPAAAWYAGLRRPMDGETVCGDGYAARLVGERRQIMLCDGLGHGALAAIAADALVTAFHAAPAAGPQETLNFLHRKVTHTRGAVVGIADLDPVRGAARFAGIGNIGAVVCADSRRAMVSLPGIVGHQARTIREFEYPLTPGALVVLHTDGLTDRWDLADYPGLSRQAPVVVAATLLRDAGKRRDDAAVLVATAT
ncbi:SpoIIE family protein phosphatase [Hamadaea tsunoensis]|uniref:SpoIIE family protein phosphatase n=1 Tax=Hamadaea tsunoensis TaxID=53368 RepID=UPI0005539DEC|nr:SpoIIE family protein phosphatase [Hamadaea tsunoensis]